MSTTFLFIMFIFFFILISLIIILSIFLYNYLQVNKRDLLFTRYSKINDIVSRFEDIAYDKIFKEDILPYNTSGFKLSDEDLTNYRTEFIKLVISMCGNNIQNDIIDIFGDLEPFIISIGLDFNNKVIRDEHMVISNMMYTEEELENNN